MPDVWTQTGHSIATQTDPSEGCLKPTSSYGSVYINKKLLKNRRIYSYNLSDGDGYNKDKLLEDKNIASIGVEGYYTSRYGGFEKYLDSIRGVTHIITYKSKMRYGSLGGIFQDIHEIGEPIIIKDMETHKKYTGLSPGVDMTHKIWKGKEDWLRTKGNYGIMWHTKLVKEITIPFKDSNIKTRTRFGYVNENNDIYKCF